MTTSPKGSSQDHAAALAAAGFEATIYDGEGNIIGHAAPTPPMTLILTRKTLTEVREALASIRDGVGDARVEATYALSLLDAALPLPNEPMTVDLSDKIAALLALLVAAGETPSEYIEHLVRRAASERATDLIKRYSHEKSLSPKVQQEMAALNAALARRPKPHGAPLHGEDPTRNVNPALVAWLGARGYTPKHWPYDVHWVLREEADRTFGGGFILGEDGYPGPCLLPFDPIYLGA